VDPLASDRLGRLGLSVAGLRRRDRLVLSLCRDHHCPVVLTMGGGYGRPIEETVEAHANTFRELEALWPEG
jgi:acetoin utilization deacetylase AcuC-like enzyme